MKNHGVQVGFGFAGSRLNVNGSSRMEGAKSSQKEVVVQNLSPAQIGVQQARSRLLANEVRQKTGGKQIKRLLGVGSRQKPSGGGKRKTSTIGKSKAKPKKSQPKKKKKQQKKTKKKNPSQKKKSTRTRDNFSI